ncbi:hypothetical protein GF323_03215 [Candidatus Woesearchaeota archaeon]|nr:hypothetical protein [Candidatus Woesearchaeota archaeon]
MVSVNGLVDLFTADKLLEDIMLSKYPGIIKECQHVIDTSGYRTKSYCFLNLEKEQLYKFMEEYKDKFEYQIRDSQTGRVIQTSMIQTGFPMHLN